MLRPLRTYALRLDLCDGILSWHVARAGAREPEVDDGALLLSLCSLSVSVLQAGVYFYTLSVPSHRSSLKARVLSGHSITARPRLYLR